MIIVSQDKKTVVNFENVEYLQLVGKNIIYSTTGLVHCLGAYETEERAKEVLNDLLDEAKDAYFWSELPKR